MTSRKPKMEPSRNPEHIMEAHPNPHGEQHVAEMPRTDHSAVTDENVGQNTSTRGNRLNPSVSGTLEEPTTDSRSNAAKPQTRKMEESAEKKRPQEEKTSKKRRVA